VTRSDEPDGGRARPPQVPASPDRRQHRHRRHRRDRRDRGVRGPLAPAGSPLNVSRGDRFGDIVLAAVERLEPRWGQRLPALDVEVHDVPPAEAGSAAATGAARGDDVPLATHRRATRDRPPVVVVYRRPVELRAPERLARVDLVRDLVAEQLAEILGVDPGELDPAYDA
jgi:hypothetical protein